MLETFGFDVFSTSKAQRGSKENIIISVGMLNSYFGLRQLQIFPHCFVLHYNYVSDGSWWNCTAMTSVSLLLFILYINMLMPVHDFLVLWPVTRRPEITILSAEPLAATSWFPGASAGFPPPPPPAAQIWGPTIPPSIQVNCLFLLLGVFKWQHVTAVSLSCSIFVFFSSASSFL